MTASPHVYRDTNVMIMLGENVGPEVDLLYELMEGRTSDQRSFCTSELSLSELLVQPLRNGDADLIELYQEGLTAGNWMAVAPISRDILLDAAALRARHRAVKLPDAIHLATALALSCSHFLTADKRLPSRIDRWFLPPDLASKSSFLQVIAPTTENLQTLIAERST